MEANEERAVGDVKRVGIVGGGHGSHELLQMFAKSHSVTVAYVVDLNPNAPAMQAAQRIGIKTLTSVENAMRMENVDFIIEATGSKQVLETIANLKASDVEIISSKSAMLLYGVLDATRKEVNREVFNDINDIKHAISQNTANVYKTLKGIKKVSADLEMLAVNAGIQAARANEFGKGFAVVAGEVKNTARTASNLAQSIEQINEEISSMSTKIESSLQKLH